VEDRRFRYHPGVDPVAVLRAAVTNVVAGRRVSGASTLTMQLARLLEPRPRSLRGKLAEAWRALRLEATLSKPEIVTWYLNLAPYGGNLMGVEAAAQRYFGKSQADLSLAEATLLAGLPQSPSRFRPDRHPIAARARRATVLAAMVQAGLLSDAARREVGATRVAAGQHPFPFTAPHATYWLSRRQLGRALLRSTLDPRLQATAERALAETVQQLGGLVASGAVVVLDTPSGELLAMAGSPSFGDAARQGQVNGATAPRSPGSALKPFLYALAFEQGACTPATALADLPRRYGDYAPENYDTTARGVVAARVALAESLNLPAVELLRQVGPERLLALLHQAGLTTLDRGADHYGLGLVLGGCEVTLLELATAYAALARGGEFRPMRALLDEPPAPPRRLLSPGAAYLIADILEDRERLAGNPLWLSAAGAPRMAWKTGTSYGHHDAWTFAYTPELTVGVWLGNADGAPAPGLTGLGGAAPLAARVLAAAGRDAQAWYQPPAALSARPVCAVSGYPPGPLCTVMVTDWALAGASAQTTCPVHLPYWRDRETGTALCPACRADRAADLAAAEHWPPALAAWLRRHDPARPLLPAHFAGCASLRPADALRLRSPTPGETFLLPPGQPGQTLLLAADGAGGDLHWFVDDQFLRTAPGHQPVYWPLAPGRHRIRATDAQQRQVQAEITVRAMVP
jgi:penicillin-binding protein 1C